MLLINCVTAYVVLRELMDKEFDYDTAHKIMMLSRKLKPHVDFYGEKERQIMEKFAVKDELGRVKLEKNSWTLKDPCAVDEYRAEITSLGGVVVEGFEEAVRVSATPQIKPSHLEALSGFIEFGGE